MTRFFQICFSILFLAGSVANIKAFPANNGFKNVLLINSYHQGFSWTDSLTSGIIKTFKTHSDYNLYIEHLDSKQFGKSNFETEFKFLQSKYAGIKFDGMLVSDNDALDFLVHYEKDFFPNVPVVYVGISNPEDYSLEGSRYYGIKESGSSVGVVDFVRKLLPDSKRLLIITDLTTTGLIYRKEFKRQAQKYDGFKVLFPEVIDLDSIYRMISHEKDYDAIYHIGISHDKNGRLVDPMSFVKQICNLAKVPVFTNDPFYNGNGVVGGLFQSGRNHGVAAVDLLLNLLNTKSRDSFNHVYITSQEAFFDQRLLNRFNISEERLPKNAVIINQKTPFNKEHFQVLLIVLFILALIVVVLSVVNRRSKILQKRSDSQLREIETKKKELEEAHEQLSRVISELEGTNDRLKDTNINLLEAKKKAEESDKLKSAFLANVSHEIRTPLNSIVGFSSLLVDENLDEETRKSYVDLIESNTESLLVLIDEIIDLSKIEAQQLSLKKQNFSMDSLIAELYQIFTLNRKNHQVRLQINVLDSGKELFAFSDRVRVKQIFINLLSNAFKFTDFGVIDFGYFLSDKQEVILFVKDTGIGIKEEHYQAVFQRFRKLNEAHDKRIYRGTGLGLAITQKLVELLGGKIWIESQFGVGSAFYFTLQNLEFKEKESKKNQPGLVKYFD